VARCLLARWAVGTGMNVWKVLLALAIAIAVSQLGHWLGQSAVASRPAGLGAARTPDFGSFRLPR
jgi:hypothetical protein